MSGPRDDGALRISREETDFLKGAGILLIMAHNFYRWVPPITGENEFAFHAENLVRFLAVVRLQPWQLVNAVFSYVGFHGVQIFTFLSAYGLAASCGDRPVRYVPFLRRRLSRLYPPLALGAAAYLLFEIARLGTIPSPRTFASVGWHLAMVAPLVPEQAMAAVGPWWFFGMIFQFYVVFPLLLAAGRRAGPGALAAIGAAGLATSVLLYDPLVASGRNPYQLFVGHLPEFCLGVALALRPIRIPALVVLVAALLFVGGNASPVLWPFQKTGACVLLLVAGHAAFRRLREARVARALQWIGVLSMYLFVVHGFLRWGFVGWAQKTGGALLGGLALLLFLAFATGAALGLRAVDGLRVPSRRASEPKSEAG